MQIKIYRGTHQIGGCITEIKTTTHRILIDIGEELPSAALIASPLSDIPGVTSGTPACDAVLITHYHGDHAGMFEKVLPQIPVYMGNVAKRIYEVVQSTLQIKCGKGNPERVRDFKEYAMGKPLHFGDITVTPYMIDHSAFDSYMLLIEADGKRILHTGDFRMHGAKGKTLPVLLEKYCKNIDVLITEGTMLSRPNEKVISEHELGAQANKLLRDNKYVFAICSSTNIDTIAEFYQAAIANKKPFIVCEKDFQAKILTIVTQSATSPFYRFNKQKIYSYANNLHAFMAERGFFFLGRTNTATKKALESFPDSLLIYSMWNGYLNKNHAAFDSYKCEFIQAAVQNGCRLVSLHTSGHATAADIKKVCEITNAKTIIPIHSENPEALKQIGIHKQIVILQDTQSYTV